MTIKKVCLEKALMFLKACGAEYVVTFEGEIFQSDNPEPEEEAGDKQPRRKNHFSKEIDYMTKIESAKIGDVISFTRGAYAILRDDKAWSSFVASVSTHCRRAYGPGACVIRNTSDTLEILRAQ